MLDGIDALIALDQFGTVSEAATRLRLTQSAVSKRIQALQRRGRVSPWSSPTGAGCGSRRGRSTCSSARGRWSPSCGG